MLSWWLDLEVTFPSGHGEFPRKGLRAHSFLWGHSNGGTPTGTWGRVNREVQTVNWEAGKKEAVETGVKSGLKRAHKPWIRGQKGAQTVNYGGAKPWSANREIGTFSLEYSSDSVHSLHFVVCMPLNPGHSDGHCGGDSTFQPPRNLDLPQVCARLVMPLLGPCNISPCAVW